MDGRLLASRNSFVPPRLVEKVQWYRVDDWGNTEKIDGAAHHNYTVSFIFIYFLYPLVCS
jgi:hypothetical protein